jgi:hypothetical protein
VREFPHFGEVYDEYEGKFSLLSIAKDDRPSHDGVGPREMVAAEGWHWDFGYGEHIAEAYGVSKIPVTIFIDAGGTMTHIQTGYMEKDAFVYQLERILP